jgi:cohesin complex subunit SA-1/2
MEEAMSGTGAPLLSGRGWEGYRAYEKRLVSIAGKDKEVKEASKKVVNGGRKGKAAVRERTETASPAAEEEEGEGSPSPTPKSRGLKRTHSAGSAKQKSPEQEVDDEDEEAGADEPEGGEGDADVNGDVDMDAEPEADPEPVDINDLILDLDQDIHFAGADFTDLNSSQGGAPGSSQRGRERSASVPVERPAAGAKRRKTGRVI